MWLWWLWWLCLLPRFYYGGIDGTLASFPHKTAASDCCPIGTSVLLTEAMSMLCYSARVIAPQTGEE